MAYVSIAIVGWMLMFSMLGLADLLFFKGKYGLGTEFEKGFSLIGPLCLGMAGIIALVPLFAYGIEHTLSPLFVRLGFDPSVAVASILALDMGGFQLSETVGLDPLVARWAGIVYGSMMGATIVFTIPVGLSAIRREDVRSFSQGLLYGIAAIPAGAFPAGLMMGIAPGTLLYNLIPPILFSVLIIVSLSLWPEKTIRVFQVFSAVIRFLGMAGLALAMVKDLILQPLTEAGALNGNAIPLIRSLGSTSEGILLAGNIGLVLSGTLCFLHCVRKLLDKPLHLLAERTALSDAAVAGFITTCANNMATFTDLARMTEREKILNTAFMVSASYVIGDHLAFASSNAPECVLPMIAGKLIAGALAVALAAAFTRKMK